MCFDFGGAKFRKQITLDFAGLCSLNMRCNQICVVNIPQLAIYRKRSIKFSRLSKATIFRLFGYSCPTEAPHEHTNCI